MPQEARPAVARTAAWLDWRVRVGNPERWVIGGGVALVGLYVVLQTADAPQALLLGWTAVAALLAVVSLAGGLTVLAAIGPFTEAVTEEGRITAVPFLLAALGVGVLVAVAQLALKRQLPRPPLAVALAVVVFVGTLLAVGLSALSFGTARGVEGLQLWVVGIGGGLTVLFAAWLVGREGEYRPLMVVVGSITLAALLSVIDVISGGAVREGALGWLLRSDVGPERLTGVIPAPNPAAAIFLVGLAPAAAAVLFAAHSRDRLLAALASVILLAAIVLTYSRSAILALVIVAAVLGWKYRGWLALALVGAGVIAAGLAALALPGLGLLREVPFWADEARFAAWTASVEMWLAAPLTGHGLRSFEWLHLQYGSTLDAPHNEWLRFFAEAGVLVGAAAVALVVAALMTLLRARHWIAAAGAAGFAAVAFMAGWNNPFLYPQVTVPAFLVVGTALGAVGLRSGQLRDRAPEVGRLDPAPN